jgi:hypothetical protein
MSKFALPKAQEFSIVHEGLQISLLLDSVLFPFASVTQDVEDGLSGKNAGMFSHASLFLVGLSSFSW